MSTGEGGLIAEYSAVRAELLKRTEFRQQLVALAVTLAGASLAASDKVPTAALAFPVIGALLAVSWAHNELRGRQLGRYVREEIEVRFPQIGWESYYVRNRLTPFVMRKWLPLTIAGPVGTFLVAEGATLAVGWTSAQKPLSEPSVVLIYLSIAGLAATLLLGAKVWRYRRRDRQVTVVFTDLDGTLLDHHTYSADGAREGLRRLFAHNGRLVFCSSKTAAEQEGVAARLGLPKGPHIVENGSAIVGVKSLNPLADDRIELGLPVKEVTERLREVVRRLGISILTFQDATIEQIQAATGLDKAAAYLAKNREYSATILTVDPEDREAELIREAQIDGLHLVRGGRFLSAIGSGADKGAAVEALISVYGAVGLECRFCAVGDASNDRAMLLKVREAYLVQRPDGEWADLDLPAVNLVPQIGPDGFSLAVKHMFSGSYFEGF